MPNPWVALILPLLVTPQTSGQPPAQKCKQVKGTFAAALEQPCPFPGGVCTRGNLTGGLAGEYVFHTTKDLIEPGAPAPAATVRFFVGESTVSLKNGATLMGIDTGAADMPPPGQGGFASVITWKDGGQIRLRGFIDLAVGKTTGEYEGTACGIR